MLWARAASRRGVNPPLEGFRVKAHLSVNVIASVLFIKKHSRILKDFPRLRTSHTSRSQKRYAHGSGLAVSQEQNGGKLYIFPFSFLFSSSVPRAGFLSAPPQLLLQMLKPSPVAIRSPITLPIHKNWNFGWIYALKFPSSAALAEFWDEAQQQNNKDTSHCVCTAHEIPLSSGQEGKSRGWGTGKGTMSSVPVFVFDFPLHNAAWVGICAAAADSSRCNKRRGGGSGSSPNIYWSRVANGHRWSLATEFRSQLCKHFLQSSKRLRLGFRL